MANPSNKRPWVLQMRASSKWYDVNAYANKDEAEVQLALAQKRAKDTSWRIDQYNGEAK